MPYKDEEKNRELRKRWYEKNRDKVREYQREYQRKRRLENPEPHREASRKYAEVHRAERKEYMRKYSNEYYHRDLETSRAKGREDAKRRNKKRRDEVLEAYGGKCKCCGETEKVFLSIDHIHGGGNKHRKSLGGASHSFYAWLKRNSFPQDDFRCLCMNCQIGYARNGTCPHRLLGEKKK